MPVFKVFLRILKKYRIVMFMYIAIFVSLSIGLLKFDKQDTGFEAERLTISVSDLDQTAASKALIAYISAYNEIAAPIIGKDAVLDQLYFRSVDLVLTIEEGYAERLAAGETEPLLTDYRVPDSYSAALFDAQLERYLTAVSGYLVSGLETNAAAQKALETAKPQIAVETLQDEKTTAGTVGNGMIGYFRYLPYILIGVLVSAISPTVLVLISKEIRNRMNCSAISTSSQTAQISLGIIVVSLGVYALLTGIAALLFGSDFWTWNSWYVNLNSLVFMLFCTVLTMFLSQTAPNTLVLNMIVTTANLLLCFLGGVFVPQEFLSETVLRFSRFLPTYWYVRGLYLATGYNGEPWNATDYAMCVCLQLGFAIALFCITLLIARNKRQTQSNA